MKLSFEACSDFIGNDHWEMLIQASRDNVITLSWTIHTLWKGNWRLQLHVLSDFLQIMFLDASENTREHQRVIDLIFEITSSTPVDEGSILFGLIREDLRSRVSQGKDDGLIVHGFDPFSFQSSGSWNSNENIRLGYDMLQTSFNTGQISNGC